MASPDLIASVTCKRFLLEVLRVSSVTTHYFSKDPRVGSGVNTKNDNAQVQGNNAGNKKHLLIDELFQSYTISILNGL